MISDLIRPVLSDRTILSYHEKGLLIENEISPEQIQPNSIDLTLADTWKLIKSNKEFKGKRVIDPRYPIKYKEGTFHEGKVGTEYEGVKYFLLQPREFCLLASREILNIPNGIISFVQGRSSIARLSIQTEQAGLIDAGFRGTITFEVYNQSDYPILLYEGMRVAQVYFFKAQYASEIYKSKGKYNDQIKATGSKINEDLSYMKTHNDEDVI